jgi:hypothetical protein
VGATLAVTLGFTLAFLLTSWDGALYGAIGLGVATLPLAGAFALGPSRRRTALFTVAGGVAACGIAAAFAGPDTSPLLVIAAIIGAMLSTWFASR